MYSILVVENNLEKIEKIINTVSLESQYLRILNIASNFETAVEFISKNKYDFIIAGIYQKEVMNIVISQKNDYCSLLLLAHCVCTKSLKSQNSFKEFIPIQELHPKLKELIVKKNNSEKTRIKIHNELEYLCYNQFYVGTKYLEEIIFELYKSKNTFAGNLKKEIYPIIAKRYNKSIDTIYCDIKLSTRNMILDCKEEKIIKYFSYSYFVTPKVKEIILTILNKI